MIIPIITSFVCGSIGYFKPIAGFALFLLFNTGLSGTFEKIGLADPGLGPLQPGTLAYVMAIVALLLKKREESMRPKETSYFLFILLLFTGITLFSRITELGTIFTTKILWQIFYCLLWAPLFIAFQRMDTAQLDQCKKIVVIFTAITAGITLLIAATGSYFLYDMFATRSEDLTSRTFMSARIIVHGLWTFVPLGMWFCLMEFFKEHKHKKDSLLYGGITILIILAVVINLTRFMLLGMVTSIMFIMVTSYFVLPRHISIRINIISLILLILSATAALSSETLYFGWLGRYEEALAGGSIEGRIIRNEYVFSRLSNESSLLGNKDYWSYEVEQSLIVGDPHTFLSVWASYGLIAALTFAALMIAVFIALLKIYVSRGHYTRQSIYEWLFLCALYIQFHWSMISGDYLFEVTAFVLSLFLANVDRLATRRTEGTQLSTC
jgi:hypothetical protein